MELLYTALRRGIFCSQQPMPKETDLFNSPPSPEVDSPAPSRRHQPLAARMRPRNLDEYTGQTHILAPSQLLRRAIEADRIESLIFFGPPGTGKTSLAQLIANQTRNKFDRLNGVESNVAEIRRVLSAAANRLENTGRRQFFLLMKFIVLTRPSRTSCCRMWKQA